MSLRAIDLWVNTSMMGGQPPPPWLLRVKDDYFKAGSDFLKELSVEELVAQMDEAGVEKAVLSVAARAPQESVLAFPRAHPDRFFLAAQCDPTRILEDCRNLKTLCAEQPVVMARVIPFLHDLPPNHRSYYPLYTTCCDIGLPVSVNTGIPGPPMPGECQNPMYLDRVCLDFPELRLCMAHGADPWWGEAMRLLLKYPNLHLMTSAYLPKYFPPEFIRFMNTRGRDKALYASDHPVLSMKRCLDEAVKLDLREGVLDGFVRGNAERVFFA